MDYLFAGEHIRSLWSYTWILNSIAVPKVKAKQQQEQQQQQQQYKTTKYQHYYL